MKHIWIFFVVVTCANAAVWWHLSKRRSAQDPLLAAKQRAFIKAWLIVGNLPWLVMGAGTTFGGVPTVFDYLNPLSGERWVMTFWATVIGLWIVGAVWIYLGDGARVLGSLSLQPRSPAFIKVVYAAGLVVGTLVLMTMAAMIPGA